MNPLLLFGGLADARKSVGETVHRTALGLLAYAVLVCSGLVAAGFLTAGCFLYLTELWGAVTASMIVAAIYAITGSIGFLVIKSLQRRHRPPVAQPLSIPGLGMAAATASKDIPGGITAVGLLAAAGYVMGRSMARRR